MSAPTFLGVSVGRSLRQDGGHRAVPVDYLGVGKGSGAEAVDLLGGGLGVLIGACIYSHPPMTYFALLGLGVYFLFKLYQMRRERGHRPGALFIL